MTLDELIKAAKELKRTDPKVGKMSVYADGCDGCAIKIVAVEVDGNGEVALRNGL